MTPQTSSSSDQVTRKVSGKTSKSLYFFLGFLLFSFIFAFIIGGFILGKQKNNKQKASTKISEQIKIKTVELPDNPENWNSYKIQAAGIELKLPEKLTKKGTWKEEERSGSKGAVVCFNIYKETSINIINLATAGGAGICGGNGDDILIIGGSSIDFEAGREGMFTDLQGFTKENGIYYAKFVSGNKFALKNVKLKELENENEVEIIKILGENEKIEDIDAPISGTPGKGYLGAIINTKNSRYPGLSIQLKLDSNISEYEFDQILKSIKFIN